MKRILALAALMTAMSGLFAAINNPAATVFLTKTTVILTDELNAKVKEYQDLYTQAGQDPTKVQPVEVLNVMINDELFRQGAARDGVVVSDVDAENQIKAMQSQYAQQGVSEEQFRQMVNQRFGSWEKFRQNVKDQILVQRYMMQAKGDEINAEVTVSDNEVSDTYRRNKTQFIQPENVKISHIYIPFDKDGDTAKDNANKALLDGVARDIKSGKTTFEEAVLAYSQDEGSKNKAGDIGWLTTEDKSAVQTLGQDFVDQAFETPVGKTSDVIVSNQGYHIVKILSHGDAKFLGLDDKIGPETNNTVRDYIKATLVQQKQQEQLQKAESDLIKELREKARIKVLYK